MIDLFVHPFYFANFLQRLKSICLQKGSNWNIRIKQYNPLSLLCFNMIKTKNILKEIV